MNQNELFRPVYGRGVTVAPGTTTASTVFTGGGFRTLCVTNLSASVIAYVRVGTGAQTATAADYPIPLGAQVCIDCEPENNTVAYITASGTGSLHIIPGNGA
jgi:hypothetical protein